MAAYGMRLGAAFQIADDISDRDGYAGLFGAAKARRDAAALIEKAKAALEPFGAKAGALRAIADHVGGSAGRV
jgi:farnesyl diphosphate synthase